MVRHNCNGSCVCNLQTSVYSLLSGVLIVLSLRVFVYLFSGVIAGIAVLGGFLLVVMIVGFTCLMHKFSRYVLITNAKKNKNKIYHLVCLIVFGVASCCIVFYRGGGWWLSENNGFALFRGLFVTCAIISLHVQIYTNLQ